MVRDMIHGMYVLEPGKSSDRASHKLVKTYKVMLQSTKSHCNILFRSGSGSLCYG